MKREPFLYAIAFTVDGCFAVVGLCVPLLALSIGATYDDLGGIYATQSIAYSITCFALSRWSDRVGYRRLMTLSTGAIALLFLGFLAVDRVWQLFLLAVLIGTMLAGFWPSLQAWLGRGKDRRRLLGAVGRFNVAWSFGFLVGPTLGGVLYAMNPRQVFVLASAVVGLVFAALLLGRIRDNAEAPADSPEHDTLAAARRYLPVAWIANFATFYAVGTVRSLFPKLATDLGIGPAALGYLMGLIGLGQVISFLVLWRTDRWQFRLAPLATIQGLAVAALALFAATGATAVFGLGMLVCGVLIGTTFTSSIFYSLHARGSGGRRAGIHEGIVGTGVFLGPLAGGLVAEHVGARAPYLVAMAVLVAAFAVEAYLLWRSRPQPAAAPAPVSCGSP